MAKTEQTRAIEDAIRTYHPAEVCGQKINKFRPTHTAFEVPAICGTTTGGIVDAVRIQEYFGDRQREGICRAYRWNDNMIKSWCGSCPRGLPLEGGAAPECCDNAACRNYIIRETGTAKILITCYEIKVTKSDFKSKNGHNFIGNCNYYVIPSELYQDVADLVPQDIGIILYLSAGSFVGLRRKKECTFKDLDDEQQKWLVLSVMKRLEDTTWKEWHNPAGLHCDNCANAGRCDKRIDTGYGLEDLNGCGAWKHKAGSLWM